MCDLFALLLVVVYGVVAALSLWDGERPRWLLMAFTSLKSGANSSDSSSINDPSDSWFNTVTISLSIRQILSCCAQIVFSVSTRVSRFNAWGWDSTGGLLFFGEKGQFIFG